MNELCITKVDVLNNLHEVKICKTYQDKKYDEINFSDSNNLNSFKLNDSDFQTFPSWGNIESDNYDNLPINLKHFIQFIEDYLKLPINIVSFGPERNQTIIK